jgi:hypothetical protein
MKYFVIAEYIGDEIRIGFIVRYAISGEQSEKVVQDLFDEASNTDSLTEYFNDQGFKTYPIGGDDYSFPNGTYLTNGSLSVFSVKLESGSTLNRFIHERRFKTQNFEHTEMEKLVDGYTFHKISCIN